MPDGSLLGRGDAATATGDRPVLEIVRPQALFERLAHHPKIGIGEAYVAGDWRAGKDTDLAELLLPFAERVTSLVPPALARLRRVVDRPIPKAQRNSVTGSRGNIEAHYDLGNDLFAAFLDESLSYSSALFDDARPWSAQTPGGGPAPQGGGRPRPGAGAAPAPGCWRSAPAGARSPSRPPGGVPGSPPSPCRPSRPAWPGTGSPPPGWPTPSTSGSRTIARSTAATTRSSASR